MGASYSFWDTLLKLGPEINFFKRTNFAIQPGWNKGWNKGKNGFLSDFLDKKYPSTESYNHTKGEVWYWMRCNFDFHKLIIKVLKIQNTIQTNIWRVNFQKTINLGISSHCVTSDSFPFNLRYLEYKVGHFLWYKAYLNPESCQNISSTFCLIAILVLGLNYS